MKTFKLVDRMTANSYGQTIEKAGSLFDSFVGLIECRIVWGKA